ncbi:hypothetical protein CC79DRAFT_1073240 [Sarocladium strictum]
MSSSDEGEIVENGVQSSKATSLAHPEGSGVDRRDRLSSRHSTPDRDSASRDSPRRSRSPRGFKRSRDERDSYGRSRNDARQGRGHYDDVRRDNYGRSRLPYDDSDRSPRSRDDRHGRDRDRDRDRDDYRQRDRDRFPDKRPRQRSRSPRRHRPEDGRPSERFVRETETSHRDEQVNNRSSASMRTTDLLLPTVTTLQMVKVLPRSPSLKRIMKSLSLLMRTLRSSVVANDAKNFWQSQVPRLLCYFRQ